MVESKVDFFGRSQADWFAVADNEARRDAIALAEIIQQAKHGFGLDGVLLQDYLCRVVLHLLHNGARPVVSSEKKGILWESAEEFKGEFSVVVSKIIERWQQLGSDEAYFV